MGSGIRSLNVALRQMDLYVCMRPVRYFDGVPTPVTSELVDMVIFETVKTSTPVLVQANTPEVKVIQFLQEQMGVEDSFSESVQLE